MAITEEYQRDIISNLNQNTQIHPLETNEKIWFTKAINELKTAVNSFINSLSVSINNNIINTIGNVSDSDVSSKFNELKTWCNKNNLIEITNELKTLFSTRTQNEIIEQKINNLKSSIINSTEVVNSILKVHPDMLNQYTFELQEIISTLKTFDSYLDDILNIFDNGIKVNNTDGYFADSNFDNYIDKGIIDTDFKFIHFINLFIGFINNFEYFVDNLYNAIIDYFGEELLQQFVNSFYDEDNFNQDLLYNFGHSKDDIINDEELFYTYLALKYSFETAIIDNKIIL